MSRDLLKGKTFAKVWRAGQFSMQTTNWIFVVSNFECSYLSLFTLNETTLYMLALTKFVSFVFFRSNFVHMQ